MIDEISKYIKEIPLYRNLYNKNIEEFDLYSNYWKYPMLERKDIVNNFPNNWVTEQVKLAINNNILEYNTSSGTTSDRIQIFRKHNWWAEENLRTYQLNDKLKKFKNGKKAVLTTAICSNTACYINIPSIKDRIIKNTLYLNISSNPNTWDKNDVERMIEEINNFKPAILDVDPIYMAILMKKKNIFGIKTQIFKPQIITYCYEYVTGYSRKFIEKYFNFVPTIIIYGSTECGYNLFENEDHSFKRVHDRCFINFLPLKNNIYSVKITSWKNEYMPFINYRIGDLVRISEDYKDKIIEDNNCDEITIEQVCGREKDISFSYKNEIITIGDIDCTLAKLNNDILIYQLKFLSNMICQFRYTTITNDYLSEQQEKDVIEAIKSLYGNELNIKFIFEKTINPETSGKFTIIKKSSHL